MSKRNKTEEIDESISDEQVNIDIENGQDEVISEEETMTVEEQLQNEIAKEKVSELQKFTETLKGLLSPDPDAKLSVELCGI